jgi:hypothetical protein
MTTEPENTPPKQPAASPAPEKPENLTALNVLSSVFRAWFGVQNEETRKRDFGSKDPMPFIVAGIIFTGIIITGVVIAVKFALATAGH